ncbi:MAG TPA: hypothetical protein VMY18_03305 [Acidobacteriota bacterium]|nr:hypothetical protein [Acidobacteriota bacterium]
MSDLDRQNGNEEPELQDQRPRDAEGPLVRAATGQKKTDRKHELGSPSLYDDAISERTTQKKWKFPVWPVVFGLVVAGMVFSFISQPSSLERAGYEGTEGQKSELEKVVEDVQTQGLESGEGDTARSSEAQAEPNSLSSESEPAPVAEPVQQQDASSSSGRAPAVADPEPPIDPPATTARNEVTESRDEASTAEENPATETAAGLGDGGSKPAVDSEDDLNAEEAVTEPEPNPGPPPEVLEAFDRLLKESDAAGKLAFGEYTTLEFIDWRVVQQTDREIWLDLTGKWTGNEQEVHFIWSVNTEDGKVRALSQEARNLEASARNQ